MADAHVELVDEANVTESSRLIDDDLALILEALEDAAFFCDARSRVLDSRARRSSRRFPARAPQPGGGSEADRRKAQAYLRLAAKLKALQAGELA